MVFTRSFNRSLTRRAVFKTYLTPTSRPRGVGSQSLFPPVASVCYSSSAAAPLENYSNVFEQHLAKLKTEGHYRTFRYLERVNGEHPRVKAVQSEDQPMNWITNWCSNDYLNSSHNEEVCKAMQDAITKYGAGAGGTRNISGSLTLHQELEKELADWTAMPSALLFNSCYTANLGVFEALAQILPQDTVVFSDEENHASIIRGIRAARFNKQIFPHNDLETLEAMLRASTASAKIVVFESVYSMSGSISNVASTVQLCKKYGALSVCDEVHALGLYGAEGAGVAEAQGVKGQCDIVTGTLGKAVGVGGGFVGGSEVVVDCIRSFAPSFIFTTSLSPVLTAGSLASVQRIRSAHGEQLRKRMMSNVATLRGLFLKAGIPASESASHIICIPVGNSEACREVCSILFSNAAIYCQPIAYPSVPRGKAIIRITCSPFHSQEDMDRLVHALRRALSYCPVHSSSKPKRVLE